MNAKQDTPYYLAGPMSGIKDYNKPAFKRITKALRRQGFNILSPVETDNKVPKDSKWADYLRKDLLLLAKCEGIILMPGWEDSRGARLEQSIVFALGLPCFTVEEHEVTGYCFTRYIMGRSK